MGEGEGEERRGEVDKERRRGSKGRRRGKGGEERRGEEGGGGGGPFSEKKIKNTIQKYSQIYYYLAIPPLKKEKI